MGYAFDPARRHLLTGRPPAGPLTVRPPWSSESTVLEACERCAACADACPESIIVIGAGGYPEIDFKAGECSFCQSCADACPAAVFNRNADAQPFAHVAAIGMACFATRGIACQSCADACPQGAIRFAPRLGAPPQPSLDESACTGCGACMAACPADAIRTIAIDKEQADA